MYGYLNIDVLLTPLHSEQPKFYGVLAILNAIRYGKRSVLTVDCCVIIWRSVVK